MHCTSCNHKLDATKSGFVVCPQCQTVNIPGQKPKNPHHIAHAAARMVHFSFNPHTVASYKPVRFTFTKRLQLIAASTSIMVILVGALGSAAYQTSKANTLLKSARQSIALQQYKAAIPMLHKAGTYYSPPSTQRQIKTLLSQDTIWVTDNTYYELAATLEKQAKYDDALKTTAKVHKSFPGYKKVLALNTQIAQKKAGVAADQAAIASAAAAKAAADAKAKSDAVAAAQTQVKAKASQVVNGPGVVGKRFTSTSAIASLNAATNISQAQQALQSFASQYGLAIEISHVDTNYYVDKYDTFTLLNESDLGILKTYGSLFIDEWAKYPKSWVASSKVKSIAIVKTFAVQGTIRSAGPDPVGQTMYYSANYSGNYAREVVHHEFDHLITYNAFGSWAPSDPTWTSYNTAGFNYGNGGASCYLPNNTCLTGQHPIAGFVSGYGASAIEEDKAELYGYLMTSDYWHQVKGWITTDPNLAKKVSNYQQFIASRSPEMSGSYYNDVNP